MAQVELSLEARSHILMRLTERAKAGLPHGVTPAFLDRCIRTVEHSSPEDWRFTCNPGVSGESTCIRCHLRI